MQRYTLLNMPQANKKKIIMIIIKKKKKKKKTTKNIDFVDQNTEPIPTSHLSFQSLFMKVWKL